MWFGVILHIYQRSNWFLLDSQNIALHALMNNCYIEGATKLLTKVIIGSTTKIGKNTANIFTINLHFVTLNQISRYRKLNWPLTVFWPLEIQGRLKQSKLYLTFFFTLYEKKRSTNLGKLQRQKPFSPMCMLLVQLASVNVFTIVCHYFEIILTAMLLLSLKPVFSRKSLFDALSPERQYDTNTKVPK